MPGAGRPARHKAQHIFFHDLLVKKRLTAVPQGQRIPRPGDEEKQQTAGDEMQATDKQQVAFDAQEYADDQTRQHRTNRSFGQGCQTEQAKETERLAPAHPSTRLRTGVLLAIHGPKGEKSRDHKEGQRHIHSGRCRSPDPLKAGGQGQTGNQPGLNTPQDGTDPVGQEHTEQSQ